MAHGGLWPFLYEAIPQNLRHRVGRLTIQMVVEAIQESGGHEDWIEDFKKNMGCSKPIRAAIRFPFWEPNRRPKTGLEVVAA